MFYTTKPKILLHIGLNILVIFLGYFFLFVFFFHMKKIEPFVINNEFN